MSGIIFDVMFGVKELIEFHAAIICPTSAFEASHIIGTNQLKIKPPQLSDKEAGVGSTIVAKTAFSRTPWYSNTLLLLRIFLNSFFSITKIEEFQATQGINKIRYIHDVSM